MNSPNDPRFVPPQVQSAFRTDVAPAYAEFAHRDPRRRDEEGPRYGDAAGEYQEMDRGQYDAWAYVVFAFIAQMAGLGAIALIPALWAVTALGVDESTRFGIAACVAAVPAIALAYLTFRDRWKCIEMFSSRYCSGLANLSALYVPIIALVYANYRAVLKLRGR